MSTDDSISEDVSSLGALSHCQVSADGGKESEVSCVSSEGTSASGHAGPEDECARTSPTSGGAGGSRQINITPACDKIRSLCLSTNDAFEQGKNLPFINPSSLETLRALVQEIQSSGETDPEIWKDCEGRWLHLFQLVEKQYQEQILAQQEQYQCQIQLIQDEIKALVQLQNRPGSGQPHADFTQTPVTTTTTTPASTKDYNLLFISDDPPPSTTLPSGNDRLTAPSRTPFSSLSPTLHRTETVNPVDTLEDRPTTVLSSGYGTLNAWETCLDREGCAEEVEAVNPAQRYENRLWSSPLQEDADNTVIASHESVCNDARMKEPRPMPHQQEESVQPLTSWAQRQKLMSKKTKVGQIQDYQELPVSPREPPKHGPSEHAAFQNLHQPTGAFHNLFPLRRSDSLMSEASGFTYWRSSENDLYRPLPDSFDSGAYPFLQEASLSTEPQLSLREIYQSKQKTATKCADWDCSLSSSSLSPQVMILNPAGLMLQSDRTSGFTSPSHFSNPSFPIQSHLNPRVGTPGTPDSNFDCSANPGSADCASRASSLSVATTSPKKVDRSWGSPSHMVPSTSRDKPQPLLTSSQQYRANAPLASEEEGSHTNTSTLKPCSASGAVPISPHRERASSLEDPVVLSLLRQNLREKHSRHVANLKAYYESEIKFLREKLSLRDLPQDLEKSNHALKDRCKHLEKALAEATSRVQDLEAKNSYLEKKLAEWPERYAVAGATVKSLQQQLEDGKRSGNDKDNLAAHLKAQIRQLEEALQKSCRETDEKEARREREYKMLQDLLGEYDSLRKEYEGVKDTMVSTENKLIDANEQISDLNRVISKLESQVKQLEHESQTRLRFASHSNTQPSGAGLFHHPDLLLSPSKCKTEPDITHRRSPCSAVDQSNGGRKSPFHPTNGSNGQRKSPLQNDMSLVSGDSMDTFLKGGTWKCSSPPERDQFHPQSLHQSQPQEQHDGPRDPGRREGPSQLTPTMRALMELEDTRATESRAPCKNSSTCHRGGSQRTTMGFVERRHKDPVEDRVRVPTDRGVARSAHGSGSVKYSGGPETPLLRAQRSLSPEGHRSSSLPPPAHRSLPPATPTKRESLLMPLSAKSSPKRSPTENYSTAFGHLLPRQQYLQTRIDGAQDQRRHSFHSPSLRKRLHFASPNKAEEPQQQGSGAAGPVERNTQLGRGEDGASALLNVPDTFEDSLVLDRVHSLSEAEKLFDELTQEKIQVEAALSRMPGAGGRMSLQSRMDEVALENRLERLNHDLGYIRMTLKRFHVLRSSANI